MRILVMLCLFGLPSVAAAQGPDPTVDAAEVAAQSAMSEAAQLRATAQQAVRRAACLSRFGARLRRLAEALASARSEPARRRLGSRIEEQMALGPRCAVGLGAQGLVVGSAPVTPPRWSPRGIRPRLVVTEARSTPAPAPDAPLQIRRALPRFRACIERVWQRDQTTVGPARLTLRYTVGSDGRVRSAAVTGGPEAASECIERQLVRFRHAPAAEESQHTVSLAVQVVERRRGRNEAGGAPECPGCRLDPR